MNNPRRLVSKGLASLMTITLTATTLVVGVSFTSDLGISPSSSFNAFANHPVLVEGNCDSPTPGTTTVPVVPGTGGSTSGGICGDFDGDGRIGTAEDTDGADRIFGTLNAALGPGTGAAAGTGANFNGRITIVTSGRFAETLNITIAAAGAATPGNVEIEAAPGVDADIDAVLQGDPGGMNNVRQAATGITIDMPNDRRITLRNLTIRNFTEGVRINGVSHVLIENCRIQHNVNFGVRSMGNSRVSLTGTSVRATGYRLGSAGDAPTVNPPVPGNGIQFEGTSRGGVFQSSSTGNFGIALSNQGTSVVTYYEFFFADNGGGGFAGTVERRDF